LRLIGSYFELTDRVAGRPAGAVSAAKTAEGQGAAAARSDRLLISVAKRLVKSAVRRNTVKRIVREAWRAANKGISGGRHGPSEAIGQGTDESIARQVIQPGEHREHGNAGGPGRPGAATPRDRSPSRTCLVRLKQYPSAPSLAMIKRFLRKDADELFATFLAAPHRPYGRSASRRDGSGSRRATPATAGKP
jgi:hypothetical protein